MEDRLYHKEDDELERRLREVYNAHKKETI
jgi:hypothetical protein